MLFMWRGQKYSLNNIQISHNISNDNNIINNPFNNNNNNNSENIYNNNNNNNIKIFKDNIHLSFHSLEKI